MGRAKRNPSLSGQNGRVSLRSPHPTESCPGPRRFRIQAFSSASTFCTAGRSAMRFDGSATLRQRRQIDAVAFQPARQRVQIGIADRVLLAHHPRPLQHVALDQREAGGHAFRHHALHVGEGGFLARPAIAAPLMGVRHMHGGAEIAVEGLHLARMRRRRRAAPVSPAESSGRCRPASPASRSECP